MALQPSNEVWDHALLPLPQLTETALLALLDVPRGLSADLSIRPASLDAQHETVS